jgi:hypothetical protein
LKITLELTAEVSIALRRLANEIGMEMTDAAAVALRELLIAGGYLELSHELDEDTETVGEV